MQHQGKQYLQQNLPELHDHDQSAKPDKKCRNCGGQYPHKDSHHTKNKKCHHVANSTTSPRVCRTKPPELAKHVTHQDTDEEDE